MAIGLLRSDQRGSVKETKNLLLVKREKRERRGEEKENVSSNTRSIVAYPSYQLGTKREFTMIHIVEFE